MVYNTPTETHEEPKNPECQCLRRFADRASDTWPIATPRSRAATAISSKQSGPATRTTSPQRAMMQDSATW